MVMRQYSPRVQTDVVVVVVVDAADAVETAVASAGIVGNTISARISPIVRSLWRYTIPPSVSAASVTVAVNPSSDMLMRRAGSGLNLSAAAGGDTRDVGRNVGGDVR